METKTEFGSNFVLKTKSNFNFWFFYGLCALCKLKLDFVLKTKFNSNSVFVSIFNKGN